MDLIDEGISGIDTNVEELGTTRKTQIKIIGKEHSENTGHHEKTKIKIIGREGEESQIKGINEFFQKILERTLPTKDRQKNTLQPQFNRTKKTPSHGTSSIKKIL